MRLYIPSDDLPHEVVEFDLGSEAAQEEQEDDDE